MGVRVATATGTTAARSPAGWSRVNHSMKMDMPVHEKILEWTKMRNLLGQGIRSKVLLPFFCVLYPYKFFETSFRFGSRLLMDSNPNPGFFYAECF
jgi:hypothetical protein